MGIRNSSLRGGVCTSGGPWDQHFTSSAGVPGDVHPVVVCVLGAWLGMGQTLPGVSPAISHPPVFLEMQIHR